MTRQPTRLNQKTIEALQPERLEFVLWDTDLHGFGVRVRPTGRKTYIAKYRVKDGSRKQRKPTIGHHPTMSCATARIEAQRLLAEAQLGHDAVAERLAVRRHEITLTEFWDQYDRDHVARHKKRSSAQEDRRLAQKILLPKLGRTALKDINAAMVRSLHAGLSETPSQANRVLALLSSILNRAMDWEVMPSRQNPCRLIAKNKETSHERFLSEDEMTRLHSSLMTFEAHNALFVAAIRLLLFTGMRKGEVLTLRWSNVDLPNARLNLPDSKTGKKTIALNSYAIEVLRHLATVQTRGDRSTSTVKTDAVSAADYVFPSRDSVTGDRCAHAVGLQKFWSRVRRDAGLDDVRLHDLRHTYASYLAANGSDLITIGRLLGHKDVRTTTRYVHLTDDHLAKATEAAGHAISNNADALRSAINLVKAA